MVYQIILKSGQEVEAFGKDMDEILDMMLRHDIIIVPENKYPGRVAYILRDDISYYRFPKNYDGVAEPVQ